jgi:quinol-cytochrome oxidoreductase complex cytochrome b subunit
MTGSFFKIWNRWLPSFGGLSFSSFLIAVISGIPLAISYQVNNALDSLQLAQLVNPGALFFRALHYWSGQFFVLFTILHLIEHLAAGNEKKVKTGVWLRLMLALLFSFFVMLSGFILKGDAEGIMAGQILKGLLTTIPLIGQDLRLMVLGVSGNLELIYLHHLVTTTLFILIIIIEHARRIWPDLLSFVYILGVGILFSALFIPTLELPEAAFIRGPWYFMGLQELLHWISEPGYVVGLLSLNLLFFCWIHWMNPRQATMTKRVLVVLLSFYIILTVNNWLFRDGNWNSKLPDLTLNAFSPFSVVSDV